jgi:hypothetical protein
MGPLPGVYHFRRNRARLPADEGMTTKSTARGDLMSIGSIREQRFAPPSATPPHPPAPARSPTPVPGLRPTPEPSAPVSPFARLLRGLGREVQQGESVMRGALQASHGAGELGPGELIALQAGVYRYSEAVDLAARLIDHATTGLKTIVQGQ